MSDTIHFSYLTASYDIHLPMLHELPVSNFRKMAKWMLKEDWRNEEAIRILDAYIPEHVADLKAAWAQASSDYQHGWKKVANKRSRKPEIRDTLRENDRLTRALKISKTHYDRWLKLQAVWDDTKHQMNL